MANSITLAQKYLPILDEIFTTESKTARMDSQTDPSFEGTNTVKVLKVSTTGLGTYSRSTGYPEGDVTASWETMTLAQERGKQFNVDRMDDEETLNLTFGNVTGSFVRQHVAPEVDAYRFAKYATGAGNSDSADLTASTVLSAIDNASAALDDADVPAAGRLLYVSNAIKPILNNALTRMFGSDGTVNTVLSGYNDMPIIYTPASRFYSGVTLNDGTSSWGYQRTSSSQSFTGDGTTTDFTVTAKPAEASIINVTVAAEATTAYTYTASTGVIAFTSAPANAAAIVVNYYTAAKLNFMMVYPESVIQATKHAMPKIFDPDTNQSTDSWLFQYRLYHDAFIYDNKADGIYVHKAVA